MRTRQKRPFISIPGRKLKENGGKIIRRKVKKGVSLSIGQDQMLKRLELAKDDDAVFAKLSQLIEKYIDYTLLNLYAVDSLQKPEKLSLIGVAHGQRYLFSDPMAPESEAVAESSARGSADHKLSAAISLERYDLDLQNCALLPPRYYFPLFGWESGQLERITPASGVQSVVSIPLLRQKNSLLGLFVAALIDQQPGYREQEIQALKEVSRSFHRLLLQFQMERVCQRASRQRAILIHLWQNADQKREEARRELEQANRRHAADLSDLSYGHIAEREKMAKSLKREAASAGALLKEDLKHCRNSLAVEQETRRRIETDLGSLQKWIEEAKAQSEKERAEIILLKAELDQKSIREQELCDKLKSGQERVDDQVSNSEKHRQTLLKLEDRSAIEVKREDVLKAEIARLRQSSTYKEKALREQASDLEQKIKQLTQELSGAQEELKHSRLAEAQLSNSQLAEAQLAEARLSNAQLGNAPLSNYRKATQEEAAAAALKHEISLLQINLVSKEQKIQDMALALEGCRSTIDRMGQELQELRGQQQRGGQALGSLFSKRERGSEEEQLLAALAHSHSHSLEDSPRLAEKMEILRRYLLEGGLCERLMLYRVLSKDLLRLEEGHWHEKRLLSLIGHRIPLTKTSFGEALALLKPQLLSGSRNLDIPRSLLHLIEERSPSPPSQGEQFFLIFPIVNSGQAEGVMTLASRKPFPRNLLLLMEDAAPILAAALRFRACSEEIEALKSLNQGLSSINDYLQQRQIRGAIVKKKDAWGSDSRLTGALEACLQQLIYSLADYSLQDIDGIEEGRPKIYRKFIKWIEKTGSILRKEVGIEFRQNISSQAPMPLSMQLSQRKSRFFYSLFWIAFEAIQNILYHAQGHSQGDGQEYSQGQGQGQPAEIEISLFRENDTISLQILGNGWGLARKSNRRDNAAKGLQFIRHLAKASGASLHVGRGQNRRGRSIVVNWN